MFNLKVKEPNKDSFASRDEIQLEVLTDGHVMDTIKIFINSETGVVQLRTMNKSISIKPTSQNNIKLELY